MKIRFVLAVVVVVGGLSAGCGAEVSEFADGVRDQASQALSTDSPSEATSPESAAGSDTSTESSRPDVDPCDGSEALEEVVRYTRPDQFPESGDHGRR